MSGSNSEQKSALPLRPFAGFRQVAGPPPAPARTDRPAPATQAPAAATAAADSTATDAELRAAATYQVPYKPGSRLPSTGALIASSLAAAVHAAVERFIETNGPVDDFVCAHLGLTFEQLGRILSAEQVDAVALGISSMNEGGEFLLGDVTGFGKGRVLAAIGMAALRLGQNVIFCTEKANLFSDFWRDVTDIGGADEYGTPLIVNSGPRAKISDMHNVGRNGRPKVLFRHDREAAARLLETQSWPQGVRLICLTYSQLNRANSPKAAMIASLARNALLICDESHNIVQQSNIGKAFAGAKQAAWGKINSSATMARVVAEMMAYPGVAPWLVPMTMFGGHDLQNMGHANRRALAEASTVRAAYEGSLISRQHDMRNMRMRLIDIAENNPDLVNAEGHFSIAARALAGVWQVTTAIVDEMVAGRHPGAVAPNFGAAFSLLNQAFAVSLRLDCAVAEARQALLDGKKYVGLLSNTQEAAMRHFREAIERMQAAADGEPDEDGHVPTVPPALRRLSRTPDFTDLFRLSAYRLTRVLVRRGNEREHIVLDDPRIEAALEQLEQAIEGFPQLPLSPLDYLRRRIEAEGAELHARGEIPEPWRVGEISGRSLGTDEHGAVVNYDPGDRNNIIYAFNNGGVHKIHALLMTRAGAVGLSVHDAATFSEHGVRYPQEIESIKNPVERIQMWGRFARRGQLTEPEFSMIVNSMPGDTYDMVVQSKKVADVSAVVTGSSKSLGMVRNVPDPIDAAGERAAQGILADNSRLRQMLMVSGPDPVDDEDGLEQDEGADEFGTALALLRRIRLVAPVQRQRQVFENFLRRRAEIVMAYPEEPAVLAGLWRVTERQLLDSHGPGRPALELLRIEADRTAAPIDSRRIQAMLSSNRTDATLTHMAPLIEQQRDAYLEEIAIRHGIDDWQAALVDAEENPVKTADRDIAVLRRLVTVVGARTIVTIPDDSGQARPVIVTKVSCRSQASACLPRAYEIEFVRAGDDQPGRISLEPMVRLPQTYGLYEGGQDFNAALRVFDRALQRQKRIVRHVISGDPVDEVIASLRLRGGTRSSFQIDRNGRPEWNHGVLVPRHLERRTTRIPIRLGDAEAALRYLRESVDPLKTDPLGAGRGLIISYDPVEVETMHRRNTLRIKLDGATSPAAGRYLEVLAMHRNFEYFRHEQGLRFEGRENAEGFLRLLVSIDVPLYATGADRDFVLGAAQPNNPRAALTRTEAPAGSRFNRPRSAAPTVNSSDHDLGMRL